ncbi:MAG: hypothetical protein Q7R41_04315 [Phycisphaerales bacterium]|nr:hypothetical protein [Phycisphaerales bacterium]
MKFFSRLMVSLCACAIVLVPACQNRPGNNGGGAGTGTLTAEVKTAVDAIVKELEAATTAVGGTVDGLSNVDRNANGEFGACPVVTYSVANGVGTAALNYPEGCQNDYYEGSTISGNVAVAFDLNTESLTITFADFTVDGETTNGTMSLQRSTDQDLRHTWIGTMDITTSGVGSAQGDITLQLDAVRQTITIDTASLTLDDDAGTSYSVNIEGLVIKPVANQSFVPEAGTATFEMPNTVPAGPTTLTVVVEFDANSPADGTVSVTVGNSSPAEYQLPWF